MNSYTWTCQCWLTNKDLHQFCVDTGYSIEDLPIVMNDRDRWQERVKELCYQHNLMMMINNIRKVRLPQRDARGVRVIVVGNGHGDTSLNPGPS